jgi:hypothetical protein
MARVIISTGHTSDNPGVISFALREYDLARKIGKFALKYIRKAGIISLATPPNLDLAQRIEWINNTGYNAGSNDIAIEIHINDGGRRGIEGWFGQDGNNPSEKLTKDVVNSICQDLGLSSQGVKSEFQHEMGSIAFIHEVAPIGSIVECCYIDNPEDAAILSNDFDLERIGRGIAKGVINYFALDIELPEVMMGGMIGGGNAATVAEDVQPAGYSQPVGTYSEPAGTYSQPANYQQPGATYAQPNAFQQPATNYSQPAATYQRPVTSYQPITYPQATTYQQPGGYQQSASAQQPTTYQQPASAQQTPAYQQLQQYQNYQTPTQQGASTQQRTSPQQGSVTPAGTGAATTQPKAGFLPREERKEMIIKSYAKVLGRDPNENDLNYFLNTGIREEELLKKMVDSQEHSDLVKARQEVITSKLKMSEEQNELMALRTKSLESDTIINGLNDSLAQKNAAITELNKRVKILEQQQNSPQGSGTGTFTGTGAGGKTGKNSVSTTSKNKYKGNFSDRVFRAFSDILE